MADIGFYRLRPELTVYDPNGVCPNEVSLVTEFSLTVFGLVPQALDDLKQIITYRQLVYEFPKFV